MAEPKTKVSAESAREYERLHSEAAASPIRQKLRERRAKRIEFLPS